MCTTSLVMAQSEASPQKSSPNKKSGATINRTSPDKKSASPDKKSNESVNKSLDATISAPGVSSSSAQELLKEVGNTVSHEKELSRNASNAVDVALHSFLAKKRGMYFSIRPSNFDVILYLTNFAR